MSDIETLSIAELRERGLHPRTGEVPAAVEDLAVT